MDIIIGGEEVMFMTIESTVISESDIENVLQCMGK